MVDQKMLDLDGFDDVSTLLRSGIYALAKRGTIIYIGKSKSLYARIYAHRNLANRAARGQRPPAWFPASLRGIVFDQVFIRYVHIDQLDSEESRLINLYKPKFNISLKNNLRPALPATLEINGIVLQMNAPPRPQIGNLRRA